MRTIIDLPKLNKGNCLLFSILFVLKHPTAKIKVSWNKRRNVPSFTPILDGKRYIYKPKDSTQKFKFWFNGHVVPMEYKTKIS